MNVLKRIDEVDKQLSLRVHGRCAKVPRWVLQCLEYSGDGLLSIPFVSAVWLAPILLDKPELRSFLFNLWVALMFDLALIGIVKGIIRRPRPIYNKGMYLVFAVDQHSFPSGHSSRALLLATFFWLYLPLWEILLVSQASFWKDILQLANLGNMESLPSFEIFVAIAILVWALATASSRVLLGRHHILDVMVGSLVGILEALFVHQVLYVPGNVSQAVHDFMYRMFKSAQHV